MDKKINDMEAAAQSRGVLTAAEIDTFKNLLITRTNKNRDLIVLREGK